MELSYNAKLPDLSNLYNLDSLGGILLEYCPLITNFKGLEGISEIRGNVEVGGSGIINFEGLENVTSIGGYLKAGGSTAKRFKGLENLKTIGGSLIVTNVVESFSGLSDLDSIGGTLTVINATVINKFYGLNSLRHVKNLTVTNNLAIKSFIGLDSLKSLTGDLTVAGNARLASFNGLDNLSTINGYLSVNGNDSLENFTGLTNLTTVAGGVGVYNNPHLKNFIGLTNLTTINNATYVENNPVLKGFAELTNLQTVGSLTIKNNPLIIDLHGLEKVDTINALEIASNAGLKSLSGLQHVEFTSNRINIQSNSSLKTLADLESLHAIGGNFYIQENPVLTSLGPLNQLKEIDGTFNLFNNPSLVDLQGLDSLQTISKSCFIEANAGLTSLHGFGALDSIGGTLQIAFNDSLAQLTGLDNLQRVGASVFIFYNVTLHDISSIAGLQFIGSVLSVSSNPSLSNCAIYPVCNQIFNHPEFLEIVDNASGCLTPLEVELSCGGVPLLVSVRLDYNADCQPDSSDVFADRVVVQLSSALQNFRRPTNSNGIVQFGYLNAAPLNLSLPQYPTTNWAVCQDTFWYLPDTIQDTIRTNFLLKPLNQCPDLAVNVFLPPFFRGCLVTSPMQVVAHNAGTITAEDVRLAVVMPTGLDLELSEPLLAAQNGDTLFFDLGDLPPFAAGTVNMTVRTSCANFLLGQTLCVEAFTSLSNACSTNEPAFSEIRLFSQCLSDTAVRFTLKNVGQAATQAIHDYVIIEDEVILLQDNFALGPLESKVVDVPATGSTYRMEATKYDDGTLTAIARENCGGLTPGFITAYWLNDGRQNYDFDCREIRAAYDPNQKSAIPTGVGSEHLLAANKSIHYTIEFQNTGTDTAFRVQIRDILSPKLNVNSFRPGASTHPYTWQITGADTLEFLFQPIMLPDSNVNEVASHGWVSFEIDQKPDLADGTVIENTAAIVFDYNPPIITNTVLHTIGKLTVSVDEPQAAGQQWQVLSNPAKYAATFRSLQASPGPKRFELTDAMGRVVRTEHFEGQEFVFQRGHLAGGLYCFHITTAQGQLSSGKIVITD